MAEDKFEPMTKIARLAKRNEEIMKKIDEIESRHKEMNLYLNVVFSDGYDSYEITSVGTLGEDNIVENIKDILLKEYNINTQEIKDILNSVSK